MADIIFSMHPCTTHLHALGIFLTAFPIWSSWDPNYLGITFPSNQIIIGSKTSFWLLACWQICKYLKKWVMTKGLAMVKDVKTLQTVVSFMEKQKGYFQNAACALITLSSRWSLWLHFSSKTMEYDMMLFKSLYHISFRSWPECYTLSHSKSVEQKPWCQMNNPSFHYPSIINSTCIRSALEFISRSSPHRRTGTIWSVFCHPWRQQQGHGGHHHNVTKQTVHHLHRDHYFRFQWCKIRGKRKKREEKPKRERKRENERKGEKEREST